MQWSSEGLIIGIKKHGETSVIVEAMVFNKGRHLGLVRGGRSAKKSPILQQGNSVKLEWRARLEDHLGVYNIELIKPRAAELIADKKRLYLSALLCEYLRLLPERYTHDELLGGVLNLLDEEQSEHELAIELAKFELRLLEELGFGLDIFSCALSGETEGLSHVSPRTGRAVTLREAKPYIDKLLPLPDFFTTPKTHTEISKNDIKNAFKLTQHFFSMHIYLPRQINPPSNHENLLKILL